MSDATSDAIQTWHHGLVATWWGAFNEGGTDANFFQHFVQQHDGPALDVGCGAGRVLLPCLEAGLDVDGLDASRDMLNECRRLATQRGLAAPNLHHQAMHQMDLPRRYTSMFICGSFGLGAGRREDFATIRNCYEHLAPGGAFALDLYLPTESERGWRHWIHRQDVPKPWPETGDRRLLADGTALEMSSRRTAFDPIEQSWGAEIRLKHLNDDQVLADEIYAITGTAYFKGEIVTMLNAVGFTDIHVQAGADPREPIPYEDQYLIILARRPA